MRETNIDPQNIEEMYIKYYATLKRYCIRLVSYNPRYTAIADDCVQEAFYRAIRNSKDFTSSKNQYGWLATCCLHYMLSHIRQGRRREAIIGKPVSLEAYGDVPDLMDNVLAWITRTEQRDTIAEFIAELTPLEQKVFHVYYEKGQSLKDTAQQAEITSTSARGALDRIRAKGRHFHLAVILFIGQYTFDLFMRYMK
jgi:RNA polymerase sigma factor, sigma-70 family